MKYFCTEQERQGTCYHEFFKGKWDNKTFWKEDSLLLDDDNMFYYTQFGKILSEVIPEYDPYNEIEMLPIHWEQIIEQAKTFGDKESELVDEANPWMQEAFKEYGVITILGL